MAWIKCMYADKERGTGVNLWTNSGSSTSNFSPQTVTLKDTIFNYSLIRFRGKIMGNNSTVWETYVSPQYLATCVTSTSTAGAGCMLTCSVGGSGRMARMASANADGTKITIGSATYIATSGTANNCVIPLAITGIV